MNDMNDFYTETMAKVYADQGYVEKAMDIYRYLLEREPDRQDLAAKLSEMEKKAMSERNRIEERLVPMFSRWIDLVLKHNKLKQLKAVARPLNHSSDEQDLM